MDDLTYNGLVVIGTCAKCGFVIWGPEGTKRDEHTYCGIAPAKKPV